MHVDPDRLLFMYDERILIFLKSDSFYLTSVKTPKMAANPLKKTEIRCYTTEDPAFRPLFQRYGWTLCLNRSIKRPKHFVIRHVMSTHNLYFFVKYTESVSTIRRRTPTLFKCYSLIFDRIRVLKFSNYSRRSCEQCRL